MQFIEEKLFVGGINYNTTEDTIKELFSKYGKIIDLKLIRDRITGKSKGFAFITFELASEAFEARMGLNGFELEGRNIGVKKARKKEME